ncbi:lipid droplet-associated protein [Nocardia sp. CC227C]|uniref:lipid droplet-associated protein n=1 Tax=Nocardia sp. CC227C TaxID=3044562 RepID=UPI00278C4D9D|nr:lipid droplet-associated protein [Nocardia sp. CC227C]
MFRPPFLARVAAGAAVYALEETRRLPNTAVNLPITAVSQLLQNFMHVQQFVTSLALKGDEVFDRFVNRPEEQPEWATFDEDADDEQTFGTAAKSAYKSRFDLYSPEDAGAPEPEPIAVSAPQAPVSETPAGPEPESVVAEEQEAPAADTGSAAPQPAESAEPAESSSSASTSGASANGHNGNFAAVEPEVASRYDYMNMTLAQLRARLRMLSVEELSQLLAFEQQTQARAPFVTMLTNRIATVQAK